MTMASVPEGFAQHFRRSGLTDPWEPLYSRKLDDRLQMGLVLGEAHCNSRGLVHGGLIAALADNAMGLSCALQLQDGGVDISGGLVTVSLSTDYVGAGQLGQWLLIDPDVTKTGKSICFARALIRADETLIATAHATFKVL